MADIPTGNNLQGTSLESWANLTLQHVAVTLKLSDTDDDRMSALLAHASSLVKQLPATSPTKIQAAKISKGINFKAVYPADSWSLHTLSDLGKVIGLPDGKQLIDVEAHATKLMLELKK